MLQFLVKETKIGLDSKTVKSCNYKEIDKEINTAIEDLQKNIITVGHCLEIISPFKI